MDPINYMVNVPNPGAAAFEGYAQGINARGAQQAQQVQAAQEARAAEMQPYNIQQAQQGFEINELNMQNTRQQMAMREEQANRARAFQQATTGLAELGPEMTIADIQGVVTAFPEFGNSVLQSYEALNDAQQNSVAGVLGQAAFALRNGNIETALELTESYVVAAENSGNAELAATARAIGETAKIDPNAALMDMGLALQVIAPEIAGQIFETGSDRVQSTVAVGPTISVQTMASGETRVVDTANNRVLTGSEAEEAIAKARQGVVEQEQAINFGRGTGRNEADIATGGEAAASVRAAEIGQEQGLEAFTRVGQIQSNISNLNQVIAAIDNGAKSGQIESRFPTWNAATIELRNLQNQLGLDVVGSVTFGALSEGELQLALQTALPTNLNESDLRDWIVRKRDAQQKLAGYMTEQARFLSRPGNTLAMWLDRVESGQTGGGAQPAPVPTGATPTPQAPPAGGTPSYLQFGGN